MADEDNFIEEIGCCLDPDDLILYDENSNEDECAIFLNNDNVTSTSAQIIEGDSQQTESPGEILQEFERHRLELQQEYNEFGELEPSYYCQQCEISFQTLEEYIACHPQNTAIEYPLSALNIDNISDVLNDNQANAVNSFSFANVRNEIQIVEETNQSVQENNLCDYITPLPDNSNPNNSDNACPNGISNIITGSDLLNANFNGYQLSEEILIQVKNRMMENADCYFCYDCQRLFMDYPTAINHNCLSNQQQLNDVNTNNIHMCPYCQMCFATNEEMLAHRVQCEEEVAKDPNLITVDGKNFICHVGNEQLTNASSLEEQDSQHTDDLENTMTAAKTVICNICQTTFSNEKNLKLHLRIHGQRAGKTILDALPAGAEDDYKGFYKFYCEICNKSFDENLLDVHKSMHQNVMEYNCSTCNRQFDTLANYEIHLNMHSETSAHRKVNQKPKTSSTVVSVTENGKRRYPCQHCGKEFPRPYEKVKHERIHTGEKPYSCEVCGKTFRVSYSLTLHLRTHTNIRPYVCPTCNKRFKSQSVYVHHLNTHNTERPYKCNQCPKSFRTAVQLCGHKNSHQKPFSCPVCNRPFASLYAVKIHVKTHDGNPKSKTYHQCTMCEASFQRVTALRLHLRDMHNVTIRPTELKTSNETATEAECAIDAYGNEGAANETETPFSEDTGNNLIYFEEIDVGAHTLTETIPT